MAIIKSALKKILYRLPLWARNFVYLIYGIVADYFPTPTNLLTKAQALSTRGQLEDAIATYIRGARLWPANPIWPTTLGQLLCSTERPEEAAEKFDAALSLDQTYIPAVLGRISVISLVPSDINDLQRIENALSICLSLLSNHPNLASLWERIGDLQLVLDRASDAEHSFRQAITLLPEHYATYRVLGEALARQYKFDDAAQAMNHWHLSSIDQSNIELTVQRPRTDQAQGMLLIAMQKSASEYIRDIFVSAFDLKIVYGTLGTIPKDRPIPSALKLLSRGDAFCRTHVDGSLNNRRGFRDAGIHKAIVHVRDPRQVILSWVHMIRRLDYNEFRYSIKMYNPEIPLEFRSLSIDQQIDWAIENYLPGQIDWLTEWAFGEELNGFSVTFTRYEDFLVNQDDVFEKMAQVFGVDTALILATTKTDDHTKHRNFRRGSASEWQDALSSYQIARISEKMPTKLLDKFSWPH